MTEVPISQPGEGNNGYSIFVAHTTERQLAPERFDNLRAWVRGRMEGLPPMTITEANATGHQSWRGHLVYPEVALDQDKQYSAEDVRGIIARYNAGLEVKDIEGDFFFVRGSYVDTGLKKPDGSAIAWYQPGIHQKEHPFTLPSAESEETTMLLSGFVGLLQNNGDTLMTVAQEPYAQTVNHAVVRTGFQASTAKLLGILAGDTNLDRGLAHTLDIIGNGRSPIELLQSPDVLVMPLAPADPNRIQASNIGFITNVEDRYRDELASGGRNRWCNPREVKALIRSGIVNGHTSALVAAA